MASPMVHCMVTQLVVETLIKLTGLLHSSHKSKVCETDHNLRAGIWLRQTGYSLPFKAAKDFVTVRELLPEKACCVF